MLTDSIIVGRGQCIAIYGVCVFAVIYSYPLGNNLEGEVIWIFMIESARPAGEELRSLSLIIYKKCCVVIWFSGLYLVTGDERNEPSHGRINCC